jgi:hypothetical protein
MDYENLTSPCGRDCFNCPFYLTNENEKLRNIMAERLKTTPEQVICSGCRNIEGNCQVLKIYGFKGSCKIYECVKQKEVKFCSDCSDFPCNRLHPLADRADKFPHNLKVYNLCMIRKMGLENWAKLQAKTSFDKYYKDSLLTCIE